MADPDIRFSASRHLSPQALFGVLTLALVCSAHAVLSDGDTFTHLAAGLWMIEHRSVAMSDPLSATFSGAPWVAHEWLSEVLLALAYRVAGLSGVVVLTATAIAITFANLARHIGRRCGWMPTILLTAAGFVCVMPSILARPHVLAMPLLEFWMAELLQARHEKRTPSWALLPLIALWANIHGTFAFGLSLAVLFASAASFSGECLAREALRWWRFVGGAICCALLTPHGIDGLLFPLRLMQFRSLTFVNEWQPVDLSDSFNLEVALIALMSLVMIGKIKLSVFRAALLLGLVYLALAHTRHCVLLGIVGPLLLAKPVGYRFSWKSTPNFSRGKREAFWCAVALVVLLRLASPITPTDARATPISALAQLPREVLDTPVLNSVQFGGYLEMAGMRPFVDGRIELFGDKFLDDYRTMAEAEPDRLIAQLDLYRVAWTLLAVEDPLVTRFTSMPGWRREYRDDIAVIFVRL